MARERLIDNIGPDRLRAVIEDFYGRIFDDVMIGFLFQGKDRARLVDKEWEFTARLLGHDIPYTGRSMPDAHARSPILGGHFERRLKLLRDTLRDHGVDPEVQQVWIDHTQSLRGQVTRSQGSGCDHEVVPPAAQEPEPARSADLVRLKKR